MNRQYQVSNMQVRKRKNISKQPLNWIRLIQVGYIQDCFVDLKLYFFVSKLVQSLYKSALSCLLNQPFCSARVEQTGRVKATSNSYCHSNKNIQCQYTNLIAETSPAFRSVRLICKYTFTYTVFLKSMMIPLTLWAYKVGVNILPMIELLL